MNEAFVKDSQNSDMTTSINNNKENVSKEDFILIEDDVITSENILNCKTTLAATNKNNAIKISTQLVEYPQSVDCSLITNSTTESLIQNSASLVNAALTLSLIHI